MANLRVISSFIDLFSAPGSDQAVLARLDVDTEVTQLMAPDALGWAKLKREQDGLVGWAFVNYLGPAPVAPAQQRQYEVTASALELRSGPGTEYPVLATMPKQTLVTEQILPTNGWAEVRLTETGQVGWTFVEYLTPLASVAATAAQPTTSAAPAQATKASTAARSTASAASVTPKAGSDSARPASKPATTGSIGRTGLCYRPSQQVIDSGGTPTVFDISHFQGNVDAASAYAAGLRGMIHKATEGTGFVDPLYSSNRNNARGSGMLCGAYHFAVGGNPEGQARFFLEHAQPDGKTLLALDFEKNPQGSSMTIDEARTFVTYLHDQTGKWPGVYGGSYLRELLGDGKDTVLGNCWFWLADYTERVSSVPPTWDYWTMWQYTDGNAGPEPHSVAGVPGGRCDRDRFVGDQSELVAFWTSCGA